MGNKASSDGSLTQEQKDIRNLADRMAFGDRELQRVYRCYHSMRQSEHRLSFFSDWALYSARLAAEEAHKDVPTEETQEEKKGLLQVMEHNILPQGFGNGLYRHCFLPPKDNKPIYDHLNTTSNGATNSTATTSVVFTKEELVDEYTRVARLEKFFDGASNCSGRRGNRVALTELVTHVAKYYQARNTTEGSSHPKDAPVIVTDPAATTTTATPVPPNQNDELLEAHCLVVSVYRLALACSFLGAVNKEDDEDITQFLPSDEDSDHAALKALSQSIIEFARRKRIRANPYGALAPEEVVLFNAGMITKEDALEWSEMTAPLFSVVLPTLLHFIMFPDVPYPPSRTSFDLPRVLEESCFFDHGSSPLLFSFGCLSSSMRGTFVRLYTSLSDGLSFNRLQNALLGYGGPTLLLIRETQGGVFGAFTVSSWKESKDFYGNSDCFLYQLLPMTAVYRPSGNETNYMYCNSEARSRGYDGLPHGIGFGGTAEQPRLFLNEEFDKCVASSQDLTFESGPLLPRSKEGGLRKHFEIDSLEVWGVGGEEVVNEALGARSRAREIRDATIRKSRKVDRASFLDDFRSGLIDSKAFKYRDEIQGRADVDVEERAKMNRP